MQAILSNTLKPLIGSLLISLSLTGCSSTPYVDYDTGFDFAAAHNYYFIPADTSDEPLMGQRVAEAIRTDLSAKALQEVDSREAAAIAVTFAITAEQKPNSSRVSIGLGTGSYGGGGGAAVGGSVSKPVGGDMKLYNTVQIDMYPADSDRLIWRSSDSFEIKGTDALKKAEAANKLVTRILAGFPPRP